MQYKNFITGILKDASKIATDNFGKVPGYAKKEDKNQVLTKTDLEIGDFLVGKICENYPTHNIIDEEAGIVDNKSKFTWVVDPIDGTSNFANGIPMYGIMVALLEKGQPVAGGIAQPSFLEIFYAEKNQGAFCNNTVIRVSQEKELINSLVAYGIDGHQENTKFTEDECFLLSKIVLKIRNLRASNSCYDFTAVATGKYGAYLNQTSKIWDNVAPQIIIEEAGGIYTDFRGKPIDYSDPISKANNNFIYVAAAPEIHKQLLSIILA